jgi:hypothetical protein
MTMLVCENSFAYFNKDQTTLDVLHSIKSNKDQNHVKVTVFNFVDRGESKISVGFNKSTYYPSDVMVGTIEVDNKECKEDCVWVRASLVM